jgi:hypothetical protein
VIRFAQHDRLSRHHRYAFCAEPER